MASPATQQRQIEPVPPGRYWSDLSNEQIADFESWIRDMDGAAVVDSVERETRLKDPTRPISGAFDTIDLAFFIWHVPEGRAPFFPRSLGFPNFAPVGQVHRRADVTELAPPEPLIDVPTFGLGLGVGALALLALIVLAK